MQTCVPVVEPTVGGKGWLGRLSPPLLKVISDCTLQEVGFPGLGEKKSI